MIAVLPRVALLLDATTVLCGARVVDVLDCTGGVDAGCLLLRCGDAFVLVGRDDAPGCVVRAGAPRLCM